LLEKHKKISKVRFFFCRKCVEDGHMAKPYEPWSPINRGAVLPLAIA
jgi:hypothetical protein